MIYSNFKEKILSKFKRKSKKKKDKEQNFNINSKFRDELFFANYSEEEREQVLLGIELCEGNLKLAKHKNFLLGKKAKIEETLKDIECYNSLLPEEAENLKSLINKFIQLSGDRRNIMFSLGQFSSSINKLDTLKDEAFDAIYEIENAEEEERILSRDIEIIKQEQERTREDREKLEFSYKFVYIFSFVVAAVLAVASIVLSMNSLFKNESILVPLTILFFVAILSIALVYIVRRKIYFELKLNEKKQAKIINLLNKKTVVYAYYLNFLNFVYDKYGIKNSKFLKNNLSKHSNYTNTMKRYDQLGKILFESQRALEDFIEEKNILITNNSLESFAKSINIDNKISYSKNIYKQKLKIEEQLEKIEEEQQEIWKKLVLLEQNDTTKEKSIKKLMNICIKEVQKLETEKADATEGSLSNENIDNKLDFD